MKTIIQRSPAEIQDKELAQLFEELETLKRDCCGPTVQHSLYLAFLFNSETPVAITREQLNALDPTTSPILCRTVGKLGAVLHEICFELAKVRKLHVENFHGTRLSTFLYKMTPRPQKKKKAIKPHRERI